MTPEIMLVLGVLAVTILLFVTELLRVDVVAVLVMLALGWLGLVSPQEVFSGFASNAVISIVAVMILGYGVDRTGVMQRVTRPILRLAGGRESRLTALVSATVGGISAFMQNVGAAALFLPALMRISRQSGIPASRLLMPMGFAAILGGTLSMVGSSPLIILNDLMRSGGQETFGLFAVTPIGLALLAAGILYFVLFGKLVLPAAGGTSSSTQLQQALMQSYQLPGTLFELRVAAGSPLIGKTREEVGMHGRYHLSLVALEDGGEVLYAPWRHAHFARGQVLAVIGDEADARRFASDFGLELRAAPETFEERLGAHAAGFAEVVVAPRAPLIGQTLEEIALRRHYGVEPLVLVRRGEQVRGDFSDEPLQAGDALIVYGRWERIKGLADEQNFVPVPPVQAELMDESKANLALLCFAGAIGLALAGVQLSLALMSGALAMVLLRVLPMDEAYKAVDWRTVFLLAGLIPLGLAMEKSGAAVYVATQLMSWLHGAHVLLLLLAVAVLATLFSLFMSNVAATVLLVPLVISMGQMAGIDPRALALLVGICASNSFFLPTHQVNALLMGPGGYRNADFMRAGGIMSVLFIVIAVGMSYLLYL